jgi:hypothetical protein
MKSGLIFNELEDFVDDIKIDDLVILVAIKKVSLVIKRSC